MMPPGVDGPTDDELVTEKGVLVTGNVTGSSGATNW